MKIAFILLSMLLANSCLSQQVSTLLNSSTIQIDDALILDDAGNLYGSHYMGSKVYKIDVNGNATTFYSGLNTPNGLAFDSQKNMYIVDNIGNKVYKVDSTGTLIYQVSVSNPSGIIKSIDSDTMIITQYTGHAMRQLSPDGIINTMPIHFGYPLNGPVGLAYGTDSSLYIGNFSNRKIFRLKEDSLHYVATLNSGANSNIGFLTWANGLLYATSFAAHKIYAIEPNFIDSTWVYAGSTVGNLDGPINQAKFNSPNGIIASKGGDSLYISDFTSGNIRLISGLINTQIERTSEKSKTVLYPNPSQGRFMIESSFEIVEIELFSMEGKQLYNEQVKSRTFYNCDTELSRGAYILRIHGENTVENHRVIIQ